MNFEELGVRDDLLRGIADMGFETPMPVQEKVIPYSSMATTTLWLWLRPAPGKTAAFGLPVIQRIDISRHVPQAPIPRLRVNFCLQIAATSPTFPSIYPNLRCCPSTADRASRARYAPCVPAYR